MKIGTRLMLSYLGIALLAAVGTLILADWIADSMAKDNLTSAEASLQRVTREHSDFAQKHLRELGEDYVEMKGNQVAAQLAAMMPAGAMTNYDLLRKDPDLRRAGSQDIVFHGQVVGHVDVIDDKGLAVLHPSPEVEGTNYEQWKDEFPAMWELVRRSFSEKRVRGYYKFPNRLNQPTDKFMSLTRVAGTPFIVASVVEINKFFEPLQEAIRANQERAVQEIRTSIETATDVTRQKARPMGAAGSIVMLAAGCGFGFWFTRSISRPTRLLRDGVKQIGQGNFQAEVEIRGPEEIRQLADSFNALGRKLTQYMENLAQETAAKQKIESELSIAAEIQQSLIPPGVDPFPSRSEFELYAMMQPARQVGGDFYDFFFLDERRLCFVIGDVCGKGVPAALLMAVTKSLFETTADVGLDSAQLMGKVNQRLAVNNESCNFVTVFCGILDVTTGELNYANAGHEPPLLIRSEGRTDILAPPTGPALGLFENETFGCERLVVHAGDIVFTCTDGVSEAMDHDGELFSSERMIREASVRADGSARALVEGLFQEVVSFAAGAPQADDITMLALRLS